MRNISQLSYKCYILLFLAIFCILMILRSRNNKFVIENYRRPVSYLLFAGWFLTIAFKFLGKCKIALDVYICIGKYFYATSCVFFFLFFWEVRLHWKVRVCLTLWRQTHFPRQEIKTYNLSVCRIWFCLPFFCSNKMQHRCNYILFKIFQFQSFIAKMDDCFGANDKSIIIWPLKNREVSFTGNSLFFFFFFFFSIQKTSVPAICWFRKIYFNFISINFRREILFTT